MAKKKPAANTPATERVEVSGHIIDSLILPKILDLITASGGAFKIERITIGQARKDPSYALLEVTAPSEERVHQILALIADHGAVPVSDTDCRLIAADIDGAFPEGFYSSTNQRTEIRLGGEMGIALQGLHRGEQTRREPRVQLPRGVLVAETRSQKEIGVGTCFHRSR